MLDKIQPGSSSKLWALGTFRPHLPFIAPQAFFDLIDETISLPPGLGANHFDPDSMVSHANLPAAASRLAIFQSKLGKVLHRHDEYNAFLRAYLASIAYADSKLGQVLDRLEECGLIEDTLIVLWSDQGWQLGEKLAFRKFTLWERALRVPLIIAGPGVPQQRIREPVSLVDVAPTILTLAGLPANEEFSGQDLAPRIHGKAELTRAYAPSVWGAGFQKGNLKLAFSVRTEKYRYTRYWDGGLELYDHDVDPFEHDNLLMNDNDSVLARASTIHPELDRHVDAFARAPEDLPAPILLDRVHTDDGDD